MLLPKITQNLLKTRQCATSTLETLIIVRKNSKISLMLLNHELMVRYQAPLKCTGLNPHFSLNMDKGIPGREINQTTMIVFHDECKCIAVPVGSPAVYQTNNDNTAVMGAYAHELASSSIMLVKKNTIWKLMNFHTARASLPIDNIKVLDSETN